MRRQSAVARSSLELGHIGALTCDRGQCQTTFRREVRMKVQRHPVISIQRAALRETAHVRNRGRPRSGINRHSPIIRIWKQRR